MTALIQSRPKSSTTALYTVFASPLGELILTSDGLALTGLFMRQTEGRDPRSSARLDDGPFHAVRRQLQAYFDGELFDFDIPLSLSGTPFQRRVWDELRQIPYGETISYAELARRVGNPAASRAVGSANGKNPVSIIVPCHRVIASDGGLGGFGGSLDRKEWLLSFETATTRKAMKPVSA